MAEIYPFVRPKSSQPVEPISAQKEESGISLDLEGFSFRLTACMKPEETVNAFLARAGCSKPEWSRWRRNKSHPELASTMLGISANLGVERAWLTWGWHNFRTGSGIDGPPYLKCLHSPHTEPAKCSQERNM